MHLGGVLITSLSDTTREARLCNSAIGRCRQTLLRMHPWGFAKRRKVLTTTYTVITAAVNNGSGLVRLTATGHGLVTGDRIVVRAVTGTTEANSTWYITRIDANTLDLIGSVFQNAYVSGGELVKIPAFTWSYQHALPSDCLRVLRVGPEDLDHSVEGGYALVDSDSIELEYVYDLDTITDPTFNEAFALYLAWTLCQMLTQSEQKREQLFAEFRQIMSRAKNIGATESTPEVVTADTWMEARMERPFPRDPMT